MAARRTVERESVPAVMYYMMTRRRLSMITAPNGANSFGNCSNQPASNPLMAPKTGPISGNARHPQTPTSHPGPCCSCTPSPNDSDGKPNTPPPNSPPTVHQTEGARQLVIKLRKEG